MAARPRRPELDEIWMFSFKPDLGPINDEYLAACLARRKLWCSLARFVKVMEGEDGHIPGPAEV